jgi:hypothetical protein
VKIEYTVKPSKAFDTLLEKNPSQIYIQIDPRPEGGVSPQTPRIAVATAAAAQASSSSADLNREKDSNNNANNNKDNNKDNNNSNPFAVAHVSDKGESEPDDNAGSSDGEEAGSSRKDEFSASSNPFATLSRRVGGGGPVEVASSSDSVASPRLTPHEEETHSLGISCCSCCCCCFVKKKKHTQL